MSICIKDKIQNLNIVIGCTENCKYCYAANNVRRFHETEDFSVLEFFDNKLRIIERKKPQNFLLTGMSDLSGWKDTWRNDIFEKMAENPQHNYVFLTKHPEKLSFSTDIGNAWFGVSVTCRAEKERIQNIRKYVKAKHYHATFEPMFDDIGEVDFSGIDWVVIGTMTGPMKKHISSRKEWVWGLTEQAHKLNIPVFWKEDLVSVMGEENMVQELPKEFTYVIEEQKAWNNRTSK